MKRKFPSLTAKGRKRAHDLERLSLWLDETLEKIRGEYAELVDDKGNFKLRGFGVDIDGSQFTKQELKSILGPIEALHDFCQEKDIRLEIAGFDLLPHDFTVTSFSASSPYGVEVAVDSSRTYCGYSHPRADITSKAEISKPRPPVPPPAPEVQDIGISRDITLHTPFRLQPKPQPRR